MSFALSAGPPRRTRSCSQTVTVEVDLGEFDDAAIAAEAHARGLSGLGHLDDLRRALMMRRIPEALHLIDRALPKEFAGLADAVAAYYGSRADA